MIFTHAGLSGMDVKQSYLSMSTALNSTGRRMHFNMCEWGLESPWTWGDAMAQVHFLCAFATLNKPSLHRTNALLRLMLY